MNILEARRRTLGKGVYKKTVEGNPAIAQGSLARRYPGITMQGWTKQDSTTGANLIDYTQAIPRITNQSVEIIDGGVKWTGDYYFRIPVAGLKKNQNYIMSYKSDNAGSWTFSYSDGTFSSSVGNGHSNTTDPEKDCSEVYIYKSNPTVAGQDMVFTNIMFNEGTTALPYEPYTGGQPSPSPDYPQEIVSAGKYNEDTQKWEYEITIANEQTDPDKEQTVTPTSDRPLTKWDRLEKRGGVWGWVYKSAEVVLDGSERWYTNNIGGYIVYCINTGLENGEFYISNFQESRQPNAMMDNSAFFYSPYFGFHVMAIRYDSAIDLTQFKNFLGKNSITLVAQTAEEIFVPLSESEQEQMNSLHTFRPTTVLSNDCDCNMSLTYKTKKSMGGGVILTD